MTSTQNQLSVFCLCIGIGFLGGLLYEGIALLRLVFQCDNKKRVALGITLDLLFFLGLAVWCVSCSYWLQFPAFRVYMWIGYAVGGIIYWKTLRRILAFCEKMCYTIAEKALKKAKSKKKLLKQGDKDYDAR